MSLLLTHGYFLAEDPAEQEIMRPYPPLGMLSISGWLEQENIDHEIFDSTFGTFDGLMAKVDRMRPKIIACYATLMTRNNLLKLFARLRADPENADLTIVLGGPDGRYNAEITWRMGWMSSLWAKASRP